MGADTRESGGRGSSELVGLVLLFGMVSVAALTILIAGGMVKEEFTETSKVETAELTLQEFDQNLQSLSTREEGATREMETPVSNGFTEGPTGTVTLQANNDSACSYDMAMDTMEYEVDDGPTLSYQAGGIFRTEENGAKTMLSPPEVSYRDGRVNVWVANFTGTPSETDSITTRKAGSGETIQAGIETTLFGGACKIPTSLQVTVQSPYYEQWGEYLAEEFDAKRPAAAGPNETVIRYDDANQSVTVDLPAKQLAIDQGGRRSSPTPVDFTDGYANVYSGNDTIRVGQPPGAPPAGTYNASLTVFRVQSGEDAVQDDDYERRPLEIMLVMDQSGSMGWIVGGDQKIDLAGAAAQDFVGSLNDSDSVGLVGFNGGSYKYQNPTTNTAGLNSTLGGLGSGGSTNQGAGLATANDVYDDPSIENASKRNVIILLSDGKNNPASLDAYTRDQARRANQSNTTIYTVGFGSPDEALLKDIANITGGKYYDAGSADNLGATLANISKTIQNRTQYSRVEFDPTTVRAQVGSDDLVLDPDSGFVPASAATGDPTNYDVNAPVAPGGSYVVQSTEMTVPAGERISFGATTYQCDDEDWSATGGQYRKGVYQFNFTTCDDASGVETSTTVDHTTGDPNVKLFTAEDGSFTVSDRGAWWQTGLASLLENRVPGVEVSGNTAKVTDTNIVLVIMRLDNGSGGPNGEYQQFVAVYEAGTAPSEIDYSDLLNVDVTQVDVEDE